MAESTTTKLPIPSLLLSQFLLLVSSLFPLDKRVVFWTLLVQDLHLDLLHLLAHLHLHPLLHPLLHPHLLLHLLLLVHLLLHLRAHLLLLPQVHLLLLPQAHLLLQPCQLSETFTLMLWKKESTIGHGPLLTLSPVPHTLTAEELSNSILTETAPNSTTVSSCTATTSASTTLSTELLSSD